MGGRRSFIWEVLYIGDPLYGRSFIWEVLYIGDPLYGRFFIWEVLYIGDRRSFIIMGGPLYGRSFIGRLHFNIAVSYLYEILMGTICISQRYFSSSDLSFSMI